MINEIEYPQIPITIDLCSELSVLLSEKSSFPEKILSQAEPALGRLLSGLGIPGELNIRLSAASPIKPLRLWLHGAPLNYPQSLFRAAYEYAVIKEPGRLPPDYGAEKWLQELFGSPENSPAKDFVLEESRLEAIAEFISLMAAGIISLQPEKLLELEQAVFYLESGREFLPDTSGKLLDKLAPEKLLSVLKSILKLKISVADAQTILAGVCAVPGNGRAEEESGEMLIAALRPQTLDVEIHPRYLQQLTGSMPQGETLSIAPGLADQKILDLFYLFADGMFYETGIRVPEIRFIKNESLAEGSFAIRVNHLPGPAELGLNPQQILVNEPPSRLADYGIPGAAPMPNPANKRENSLTDARHREQLEAEGITTWDAAGYLILALARTVRQNAGCFIDAESVEYDLALIDQVFPAIVSAATEIFSAARLAEILRELLAEGLSIRDLRSILERLLHYDYILTDPSKYIIFGDRLAVDRVIGHGKSPSAENLTQFVRSGLKEYISHKYTYGRGQSTLTVYLLDPALEKRAVEHLAAKSGKKSKKPFTDEEIETIRREVRKELSSLSPNSAIPAILTVASLRPFIRHLVATEFPDLPVLSYDELSPATNISPIARICLDVEFHST